jgi:hypothetical protein
MFFGERLRSLRTTSTNGLTGVERPATYLQRCHTCTCSQQPNSPSYTCHQPLSSTHYLGVDGDVGVGIGRDALQLLLGDALRNPLATSREAVARDEITLIQAGCCLVLR